MASSASSNTYDVIAVGLGVTGAAAVAALTTRGLRVLGLDRHDPPHPFGSSHGERRMIREAYFEGPFYVPLVQAAYHGWKDLERRSGRRLLQVTGGLMIGPPDGVLVSGALGSARAHGLAHEVLDAREVRRRFPAFRPEEPTVAVWEPLAGMLDPEACVRTFLELSRADGATLRTGEAVTGWEATDGEVTVRTREDRYRAARLLLAAGAWTPALVPDLRLPLVAERMVQFWFRPEGSAEPLAPSRCPVWAWEHAPDELFYGFPAGPRGIKVGFHQGGEPTDPQRVRREVGAEETRAMRSVLAPRLPTAAGRLADASVCLYTTAPDRHFVLGTHPSHREVVLASPCSGHGFKFAPILGELLADLLTGSEPAFDLTPFRPERFAS